jgi:hypothetical protein
MRRSICYAEPATAFAGERKTWKFVISPTAALPKGTFIKFDLASRGRSIDWEIPSTSVKDDSNVIWAELDGGKVLTCKEIEVDGEPPQFEFCLPQEVSAGKKIVIYIGTKNKKLEEKKGTLAQQTVQRRRPFYIYIDPSKKRNYSDPETVTIDIKGNKLSLIRVLAPSLVVKNRRFDVLLRFEDRFGNLTNNATEDTLIEFSHGNLRDNLKWKLFLPETGFLALPNLYFNDVGIYTLLLKNLTTNEEFRSAPIKCIPTETKSIFWGTLHGESERYDSSENIENCLRHFRDERSLNFFATSSFESVKETSTDVWKKISTSIGDFNEEDRFCALLGQQWCGEPKKEGLRSLIYYKDDKPILRIKDTRASSLAKIYKLFSPKELISIPSFTMSSATPFSFEEFNPEFERVVEIYNAWGCSEKTAKEGNKFAIQSPSKKGIHEYVDGSVMKALKNNCRFGFVAGGLDDRALFAELYDTDQKQYPPGFTAVLCDRLTKSSVFEAIYNRNCYATTGVRIVLWFTLANQLMGSELSTATKPGLHVNRHIAGFVAGTTPIAKLELIRNGEVIKTFKSDTNSLDFEYDDMVPLTGVSLKDPNKKCPFSFYFIRVTQKDGHMAWSSPIWVDCVPKPKEAKKVIAKPANKPKLKELPVFDEDEDDFSDEEE